MSQVKTVCFDVRIIIKTYIFTFYINEKELYNNLGRYYMYAL